MRGDRYRERKGRRDLEEWVCGQSCCEYCRCSQVNHYGFPLIRIGFHYMQARALNQYHNSWVELTQWRKLGLVAVGAGARSAMGKERLVWECWKQESYGMYMAEFPDPAVLQWSVHSCLLRDSRRGSYLLCVLMGQIYKRKSLLSKKLAFLREGGWIQISVKWNLEIHMWAENASPQSLGVWVCVQRGPGLLGYQSVYRLESRAGHSSFGDHWGPQLDVSGSWIGG